MDVDDKQQDLREAAEVIDELLRDAEHLLDSLNSELARTGAPQWYEGRSFWNARSLLEKLRQKTDAQQANDHIDEGSQL